MNAQLYCRMRGGSPLSFSVGEGEAVVGRDPRAQISVPLDGVSRRHARITWDGASHWIEDLKSTNGTYVNGTAVRGDVKERLRHLDVIGLGAESDLLFLVRDKPVAVVRQGIVRATLVPEDGDPVDIQLGEATLGRAPVNNVVVDSSAVSKFHAAVRRTADFLAMRDLGSANGTFVNGVKVQTAMLKDGDRFTLAGVVNYRIRIELGEVEAAVGPAVPPDEVAAAPPPPTMMMQFTSDWRMKMEAGGEADEVPAAGPKAAKSGSTAPAPVTKPPAGAKPTAAPAPAKPAAAPAPAPAKPPATAAPAPPAAPPAKAPEAVKPVAPAAAAKPAPSGPPTMEMPAPESPAPPPPAPVKAAPIKEVRFVGAEVQLAVAQPGSYEIGRSTTSPLRIPHPTVSRSQAKLVLSDDRSSAVLESVGAASPALVKGVPLSGKVVLADGDEVSFGQVVLKVKIQR